MKCIIIYGPPAIGKYTVAHELAKLNDARLFDHYQITRLLEPLVGRDTPQLRELTYSLQLQVINAAIRTGSNDVIFTFQFSATRHADIAMLQTIIEACASHGVQVVLVHLTAKDRALVERVSSQSRQEAGKLTDPQLLESMLKEYDLHSPLPGQASLSINTTHLTAKEAAEQIQRNL